MRAAVTRIVGPEPSCRKSKTGQKGRVTREPRVRRKLRNRKTGNRKLRESAANLAKKRIIY